MSERSSSASGGISFLGLLAILFIGLKLGGIIDWSWWWVTLPLWGGLALIVVILVVIVVVLLIAGLVKAVLSKRGR